MSAMHPPEDRYGIVIAKDLMVPMRDGVRLATDVYRPARDGEPPPGPFPALLARTSYDKSAQRYVDTIPDFFVPRGYVVVLQDLRGRYRSEGTGQYFHTANEHEGRDGYDTVEWIAAQPWSNGRVGTLGSSHVAMVQTHLALHRPPHLAAIWPDVGPINNYAHQSRMGGAMQLHMFGALFLHAQDAQEALADPAKRARIFADMERMRELVQATPFRRGQTALAEVPALERTLFDYYERGEYDDYWKAECNDFERHFDRHADVPGTYSGGWYDPFAIATTSYYAAIAKRSRSPQRLVIGPWTHMGMRTGLSYAGDVDFGPASVWGFDRFNAEQLRWFDRWLRDVPSGVEDEAPVRIFVMGGGDGRRNANGKLNHGGAWRAEREWPLARTRRTTYYLRAGGGLAPERPGADDPPASYSYDPERPVPTVGGAVTGFFEALPLPDLDPYWAKYFPPWARMRSIVPDGPMHQREAPGLVGAREPYRELAWRPDVLVFQTPPLTRSVEVTGPIAARLWISSSAVDTDFTAKLVDVHAPNEDYAEGYHMNLVDGIIRARYRDGFEGPTFMRPGEVYAVTIALPPTSNLFAERHRIRVDISSSNFPRFDTNPNTGEPVGRHTGRLVARNTVYLDAARPSHLVLPIIPAAR